MSFSTIQVVQAAFDRALSNLAIEKVRFARLPLRQRRLALTEAILVTTGELTARANLVRSRCDFADREIEDYEEHEVEKHQRIVDGLIALSCLGERTWIRPLVAYLQFPEPRWKVLIEPVLRAVAHSKIEGQPYRLPDRDQVFYWRKWALEAPPWAPLADFSVPLLTGFGTLQHGNTRALKTSHSAGTEVRKRLDVRRALFDTAQAYFCEQSVLPSLRRGRFSDAVHTLDAYLSDDPGAGSYETLVASLKDGFDVARVDSRRLKHYLLDDVAPNSARPLTWVILFRAVWDPPAGRRPARLFARKIGGPSLDHADIRAFSDILTRSINPQSATRISRLCVKLHAPQEQEKLVELASVTQEILQLFVTTSFAQELESVCILGAEQDSRRKRSLMELLRQEILRNNRTLKDAARTEDAAASTLSYFGRAVRMLLLRRTELPDLLTGEPDCMQVASRYLEIWRSSVSARMSQRVADTNALPSHSDDDRPATED